MVRQFMKNCRLEVRTRKQVESSSDPGANGLGDGYCTDRELQEKLTDKLLWSGDPDDVFLRFAFLLSHFAFLRSDELLSIRLSDALTFPLFEVDPAIEGNLCTLFGIRCSKTNKDGDIEYASVARNANLNVCPVSAFAISLFLRFQIAGEPFPDLLQTDWFDTVLFTELHRDPMECVPYHRYYSVCKKILGPPPQEQVEDPNDVHTKKVVSTSVTHMFRKGGTRHGNLLGFSKDDLENHGRWTKRVIAKHYLTPIETPVVKSFAGYGKGEKYTLPRRFPALLTL